MPPRRGEKFLPVTAVNMHCEHPNLGASRCAGRGAALPMRGARPPADDARKRPPRSNLNCTLLADLLRLDIFTHAGPLSCVVKAFGFFQLSRRARAMLDAIALYSHDPGCSRAFSGSSRALLGAIWCEVSQLVPWRCRRGNNLIGVGRSFSHIPLSICILNPGLNRNGHPDSRDPSGAPGR